MGNGEVAEKEHRGELPRGYIAGIYAIEEWRIDDGSFVKLREVSLRYSLGRVRGLGDISVNVSGRNLITWCNSSINANIKRYSFISLIGC